MTNVIVMTSRDLLHDGGEASLMESKRKSLLRLGIEIRYFLFSNVEKEIIGKSSLPVASVFSKWKAFVISLWIFSLVKEIKSKKVRWVVVSSPFLYFYFPVFYFLKKKYRLRISLDFQGCVEEFIEYNHLRKPYAVRFVVFLIFKVFEFFFVRFCVDLAEVVSNNGGKYLKRKYGFKGDIVIIPCGVDAVYDHADVSKFRKKWRDAFNIDSDDVCFVYCGGLSPWQNVDKVVDYALSVDFPVYIFTSKQNHHHLKSFGAANLHVHSLSHREMLEALCAFDFGFLLRDRDLTNYVAYPNKYSEYINARLRVVLLNRDIGCISERKELYLSFEEINSEGFVGDRVEDHVFREEVKLTSYSHTIKSLADFYLEN